MKLYLSSNNIPNLSDFLSLIGLPVEDVILAVIINAKDHYDESIRTFKIKKLLTYLQEIGFVHLKVIDLNTLENAGSVREALADSDALWVAGGNTFCLRYAMKKSGFDTVVKELLEAGLVYGGESAGAVVAGPSLKGIERVDDRTIAPVIIEEGLSLVPYVTIPHIDSEYIRDEMAQIAAQYEGDQKVELRDTEAIIFNDGDIIKLM